MSQRSRTTQRRRRSGNFVGAAVASIPLVLLLLALLVGGFVGRAYAQEEPPTQDPKDGMPPGLKVGNGGVEIGEGEGRVFAGDGCVEIGNVLSVGDCGKKKDYEASPEVPEATMLEGTNLQFEGTNIEQFNPGETGSASPEAASGQPVSRPEQASPPSPAPGDSMRPGMSDGADDGNNGGGSGGDEQASTRGDCAAEGPMEDTKTVTVEEATDGDTFTISEPIKGTQDVRLIGVDTPETVDPEEEPEPLGNEASTFTEKALEGETVELELGEDAEDDYDRLLAYAWTSEAEDGEAAMFNEALLAGGYGELLVIEPNDAYEGCLASAEERARSQGLGIWALEGDEPSGPEPSSPDPSEDDTEPRPEVPSEESAHEGPAGEGASPEPTNEDASPPTEEPAPEEPDTLPTVFGTEQPETTTVSSPEPSAEPSAEPEETTEETTEPAQAPQEPPAFGVLPPSPEETPDAGVSPDVSGSTLPGGEELPEVASSSPPADAFEATPSPSPSTEQYASSPPASPAQQPKIVLPDSGGVSTDAIGATRPVAYLTPLGLGSLCAGAGILSFCAVRRAVAIRGREGAGGRG